MEKSCYPNSLNLHTDEKHLYKQSREARPCREKTGRRLKQSSGKPRPTIPERARLGVSKKLIS
jgi:hypothetical protein